MMTLKTAKAKTSLFALAVAAAVLAFAMGLTACAPKNERTDETQKTIREANQTLVEMTKVEDEITRDGFYIKDSEGPRRNWAKAVPVDPGSLKAKLEKFISLGEMVLKTAARSDVTFQNQDLVAKKVANARTLLAKLEEMFKTAP